MASTFHENKIKSDQSPSQSWFEHIQIEKSNSYSVQDFSAHRNKKISSKPDDATNSSTTDSNPDLHPLRSDWNGFYLVKCDKCDYFYAHQAFMRHEDLRHIQKQDPEVYQHCLYLKKPKPINVQNSKNKGKEKKSERKNEKKPKPINVQNSKNKGKEKKSVQVNQITIKTNDSEIINFGANVVGNLDIKAGPGHGRNKIKGDQEETQKLGKGRKKGKLNTTNIDINEDTTFLNVPQDVKEDCIETNDETNFNSIEGIKKDLGHIQSQDLEVYQHSVYVKEPKQTNVQNSKNKGRRKKIVQLNQITVETNDLKRNNSRANIVGNLDVKAGPGPGENKRKLDQEKTQELEKGRKKLKLNTGCIESNDETNFNSIESIKKDLKNGFNYHLLEGFNFKEQSIIDKNYLVPAVESYSGQTNDSIVNSVAIILSNITKMVEASIHHGDSSSESLMKNQSTNSIELTLDPLIVNIKNSKARNYCNSETNEKILCQIKLDHLQEKNNSSFASSSKMGKLQNFDALNKNLPSLTFPYNHPANQISFKDVSLGKQNGILFKRFNGSFKKDSAQETYSVKQSSFSNENNTSLNKSSEINPDGNLKHIQIKEKLKTAIPSPGHGQCLQTIKLDPIKIKKALSSINRICKSRTKKHFRTFSHLKRIMPSGKHYPHQMRVSCKYM